MSLSSSVPVISPDEKEKIIKGLISKEKAGKQDDYIRQKTALEKVLTAVEEKTVLSVDLIKELHRILTPPPEVENYAALEAFEIKYSSPGEFRDYIVGSSVDKDREDPPFSIEGITEIFQILEEEDGQFDQYKGTWFGPHYSDRGKFALSIDDSFRGDNLKQKQGMQTREAFVQTTFQDTKIRPYILLFPRFDKQFNGLFPEEVNIPFYMEYKMAKLLSQLNQNISLVTQPAEIKRVIVGFIKSCLRLQPFEGRNHRVFVLCVLTFLQLTNNVQCCFLKNRRIFSTIGTNETLQIMEDTEKLSLDVIYVRSEELNKLEIKNPEELILAKYADAKERLNASPKNDLPRSNNKDCSVKSQQETKLSSGMTLFSHSDSESELDNIEKEKINMGNICLSFEKSKHKAFDYLLKVTQNGVYKCSMFVPTNFANEFIDAGKSRIDDLISFLGNKGETASQIAGLLNEQRLTFKKG